MSSFRLDSVESWLRGLVGSTATPADALAWDDLQGDAAMGSGGAALTFDAIRPGVNFKIFSFRNNQTDELHLRYQINHGWRRGTSVKFHLHYSLDAASAGTTADFSGEYVWVPTGTAVPALGSWTPISVSLTTTGKAAYTLDILPIFTATAPAGAKESSMLLIYLKRLGSSDSYAGNVQAWSVDTHVQKEKIGTEAEIPT